MRTTVNPGALLMLEGSFNVDAAFGTVIDRDSGKEVTLHGLLQSFLEDPDDAVTGPIVVTIQPAR